jgi:hypothetical protein
VVVFAESIGYLSIEKAFDAAWTVLRRRGALVITTYPAHEEAHSLYRKFRLENITRRLARAGFRIRNVEFLNTEGMMVRRVATEKESTLLYIWSTNKATDLLG